MPVCLEHYIVTVSSKQYLLVHTVSKKTEHLLYFQITQTNANRRNFS